MTTETALTMLNPMEALPSLPSDTSIGTAGLWAGLVLLQAANERGWPAKDLRRAMFAMLGHFSVSTVTDDALHAEFQSVLDGMRSRRARKS